MIVEILLDWIEKLIFFTRSFDKNQAKLSALLQTTDSPSIESIKVLSAIGVNGIGHNTAVNLTNGKKRNC